MLKTRTWICLIAAMIIVCIAAAAMLGGAPAPAVVEILQDGRVIETIDLSQVQQAYRFKVEDPEGGSNTVLVEPGRICILEADCPDQICVHRGWLTDSAAPIVCLPHRLVIQAAAPVGPDAVAQ